MVDRFSFLVDRTAELNHLNVLLQGTDMLASEMCSHVKAFSTKAVLNVEYTTEKKKLSPLQNLPQFLFQQIHKI